jgi:hypothetical protein
MAHYATQPNAVRLSFLRTEVQTGLVFASIAAQAGNDTEKRSRNRANATAALDAVMKFLPRLALTDEEQDEMNEGIMRLNAAIDAISVADG